MHEIILMLKKMTYNVFIYLFYFNVQYVMVELMNIKIQMYRPKHMLRVFTSETKILHNSTINEILFTMQSRLNWKKCLIPNGWFWFLWVSVGYKVRPTTLNETKKNIICNWFNSCERNAFFFLTIHRTQFKSTAYFDLLSF